MSEASRPQIKDYKDLQVWQKGMDLARRVYLLTRSFPVDEKFGLISQMSRAAVSVPSNMLKGKLATRRASSSSSSLMPRAPWLNWTHNFDWPRF